MPLLVFCCHFQAKRDKNSPHRLHTQNFKAAQRTLHKTCAKNEQQQQQSSSNNNNFANATCAAEAARVAVASFVCGARGDVDGSRDNAAAAAAAVVAERALASSVRFGHSLCAVLSSVGNARSCCLIRGARLRSSSTSCSCCRSVGSHCAYARVRVFVCACLVAARASLLLQQLIKAKSKIKVCENQNKTNTTTEQSAATTTRRTSSNRATV